MIISFSAVQLPQRLDNLRNLTAEGVRPVVLLHFVTLGAILMAAFSLKNT